MYQYIPDNVESVVVDFNVDILLYSHPTLEGDEDLYYIPPIDPYTAEITLLNVPFDHEYLIEIGEREGS
jgi:hypothetical protein